ncbi:MAG: LLM class flavin-dependent oxidoreductase [Pseudomonadota bacterium]|jgi:limonene 1,2-monooxygenase|nr:LLM class flavin-dependent oxidoreductase [Pseudomonadota bacterium]MEC7660488.1 LLM class flavin-dependent oxidoreductase [Pseudomonadota bacterium]MEC8752817.1 LLM class flavin-dependent oxidoreductase [Pseudomonadota bacterium]MED5299633.1 LLM class flavin-dependent oxidoreductase [Pseudomonadota bacterium]|tara:strand:- start:3282 stop:4454 length:1173 start_codon:yes stop_codon:yes gene_type:complete
MINDRLRFGIFLAPFHALNENPTNALDRDFELIEHLDRLGYDEAWIGEHHSGGFEIIASPEVFMAAAFERTKNIKIGTGVVSLPYHHPFMAVDRMIQLDHQSKGRAMFGVGPGALVGDAFRMGIDPSTQRDRMNEALDVILPLLRGEIVSKKTDWFEVREAQIQLPCYTQPHIEMAVACARSPSGALAAGKHGLGMLSIGGTSDDALTHHANNWKICEETAIANKKHVDRKNWRVVTLAHIADTREQALENVKFGIEQFARYFREIATFPIVPDNIHNAAEYLMENNMACIGTPDDAIKYIEKLQIGTGGFGAYMELAHNWADWQATKRHYELMSRYVAPHFQGLNSLRQASYNYSFENRDVFVGKAAAAVQQAIDTHEKTTSKKDIAAE